MKILFVFTGGTIGSSLSSSVIRIDKNKSYKLIDAYEKKFGIDFDYDCICPYLSLSENNTGEHISLLCSCVKDNLDKGYDGIIVTHGTDTLQYSAIALSYTLNCNIPVCVVSSSYPLENEKSNALINLHAGILTIKNKLGNGVFVPFKNTKDEKVKLHRATRLISSISFSDEVKSRDDSEYGYFDKDFTFVKNKDFVSKEQAISPFNPYLTAVSQVVFLHAYPGMQYPLLSEKIKYVLISAYHSGTIDTQSENAKTFYKNAKENGIKVFVCGVKDGDKYESATVFSALSITPIFHLSPLACFVKLWLIASQNKSEDLLFLPLGQDL